MLVAYTNGSNPTKAAIANQVLNNFENTDIINSFFDDFCSSELDELDLSQLLGVDAYKFYLNNKKQISLEPDDNNWIALTRLHVDMVLKEITQELKVF
ncbi:protein of unknown function [Tenacibaculum sp. 190524A02b]